MNSDARPRDLAVFILAAGNDPPRQRARDQQADCTGLDLRRDLLHRIVTIDPDPEDFERTLMEIVEEIGEPTGPTRALALSILQDWESAQSGPGFWSWLVEQALAIGRDDRRRKRTRRDSHGE